MDKIRKESLREETKLHRQERADGNKLHLNPHLLGKPDGAACIVHPVNEHRLANAMHDKHLVKRFKENRSNSLGI